MCSHSAIASTAVHEASAQFIMTITRSYTLASDGPTDQTRHAFVFPKSLADLRGRSVINEAVWKNEKSLYQNIAGAKLRKR